jgi:hypothetical protein
MSESTTVAEPVAPVFRHMVGPAQLAGRSDNGPLVGADFPLEDSMHLLDASGPVFIMGCPRSGTTVLADVIQRLPDVILKIGVIVPDRIMHLLGCGELSAQAEIHLLWAQRNIFWRAFIEMHGSWVLGMRDAMRFRSLWSLYRNRRPLAEFLFAYKEPFLIFACQQFAAHFTKAKFIHIIRDGRDCADSMERTYPHALTDAVLRSATLWRLKGSEIGVARPWKGWFLPWWLRPGEEEEFTSLSLFGRYVCMWKEMVSRGRALAPHLDPERLLELSYEEFCARPVEVGKRITAFLKTSPNSSYWRFLRSISTRSLGCYKRQSKKVILEAERVGAPLLGEMGYSGGKGLPRFVRG